MGVCEKLTSHQHTPNLFKQLTAKLRTFVSRTLRLFGLRALHLSKENVTTRQQSTNFLKTS